MSNKNEEDNKLDLQMRSLMENAEEPVPEHLWAAISDRLDAAEALAHKRLVIPVWFRRAAIGLAAAAAVALGAFLFVPRHHATDEGRIAVVSPTEESESAPSEAARPTDSQSDGISAPDTPDNVSTASPTDAASEPDLASRLASSPNYVAQALETEKPGDTGQETGNDIVGETGADDGEMPSGTDSKDNYATDTAEPVAAEVPESSGTDQLEDLSSWSGDSFEENEVAAGRRKVRTAIVMSGNAMGNGSTSSSASSGPNRQLSSSIVQQTTPGISQNSNSDSNFSIPASFGLGVKIIFTPRWSLGVGVNYSILSRTFAGTYTASTDDTPKSYSKIRHNVSYIGIPVNAYFSIVSSHAVDFYCYAGGSVEKAVGNRYVLEDDGIYKEGVKGLQCSADLGIGVEFTIVDMVGLYIDPSIRYYFPNSHQPTSIRTQEPFTFGFEIGFRIRL